jgi:hypothetical protein
VCRQAGRRVASENRHQLCAERSAFARSSRGLGNARGHHAEERLLQADLDDGAQRLLDVAG